MTVENLMKKRFKVIAPWPHVYFTPKVGDIIEGEVWQDNEDIVWEMKEYPHLFKELQWWEDRKPEDMPEYAKDTHTGEVGKVIRVIEERGLCITYKDNLISWSYCLPATEAEYQSYINTKQKVK